MRRVTIKGSCRNFSVLISWVPYDKRSLPLEMLASLSYASPVRTGGSFILKGHLIFTADRTRKKEQNR